MSAMGGKRTLAELASWLYLARMTETDRPDDWVIYATLGVFALLMTCYAIWAIRSGSFYMRPVAREPPGGARLFLVRGDHGVTYVSGSDRRGGLGIEPLALDATGGPLSVRKGWKADIPEQPLSPTVALFAAAEASPITRVVRRLGWHQGCTLEMQRASPDAPRRCGSR